MRLSSITINAFPLTFYVPPKVAGDADFAGHGPRMDINFELDAWAFPQVPGNTRVVQNLTCVGDTSGDEAGTRTGCQAILHDLTITF